MSQPLSPESADLLEGLTGRRDVPEGFQRLSVAAGTELMSAGAPGRALLLVLSGRCRVELAVGGEAATREGGPGSLLGDVSFLDGGNTSATVTALSDLDVVELSREAFDRLCTTRPGLAASVMRGITRSLAGRLRSASDAMEAATTGSIAAVQVRRSLLDSFLRLFQVDA